jgi:hypothetical protein
VEFCIDHKHSVGRDPVLTALLGVHATAGNVSEKKLNGRAEVDGGAFDVDGHGHHRAGRANNEFF